VSAPSSGSMEDMEAQTLEAKLQTLRAHREWKCNVKWEALDEHAATWRKNGLADLDYEVRVCFLVGGGGGGGGYV
jgi:hypothetical protein